MKLAIYVEYYKKRHLQKESGLYKEGLHTEGGIAVTVDGVKPIEVGSKGIQIVLNAMDSDKGLFLQK